MKKKNIAAAVMAAVMAASVPLTASAEETYNGFNYTVNDDDTITITGYDGELTELVIPDEIDGKSVTIIGSNAFYLCESLTEVTIPDGVTKINRNAFAGCISLESVIIPDSVTYIGDTAFSDCKSLEILTIPESVTDMGVVVFGGCSLLKSVTIPNGITSVADGLFAGCTSLETLTLPNSIIAIYDGALGGCTSLKNIIFNGTKEEWEAVYIVDNCLEYIENATVTFNDPAESNPETDNPLTPRRFRQGAGDTRCNAEGR